MKGICCKCGKELKGTFPEDATDITCFKCCEAEWKRRDRENKGPRNQG